MERSGRRAALVVLFSAAGVLAAEGQQVSTTGASAVDRAADTPPVRVQTDWSGGPGGTTPVTSWGARFEGADGVAWRSIPGQVARSAAALGTPVQTVMLGSADRPTSVAAGDVSGDGRADVITTDPLYTWNFGAVYWWQQVGGEWVRHTIDDDFFGAEYAGTADIDGDGDQDVMAAAYYGHASPPPPTGMAINGRYAWFENLAGDGTLWRQHVVGELFWGASHIDAADFDGDGDLDLVGASELTDGVYAQDGDVVWFENADGAGESWIQHDVDVDFPNASEVHAVDLDGDGDADIVGAHQPPLGSSQFHWWENLAGNGSVWLKRAIPFAFSGSGFLDVGDIDGDGDPDLIGGGRLGGTIGFWENLDGRGTSWQAWAVTGLPGGRTIELADVDGDADLDALVANRNGIIWGGAWWIENLDGAGFAWQLRAMDFLITSTRPWIAAADVDRDGKLDAVVVHDDAYGNGTDQLAWWNLSAFDTAVPGVLTSSVLDGGSAPLWRRLALDADAPFGTSLRVLVRAADDPLALGRFVTVPASGELTGLIDERARYLQYRLELDTTDPTRSPILREVRLD